MPLKRLLLAVLVVLALGATGVALLFLFDGSGKRHSSGLALSVFYADYASFCRGKSGCEQALERGRLAFWDDSSHDVARVYTFAHAKPWQGVVETRVDLEPAHRYDPRLYFTLDGKRYIVDVVDEVYLAPLGVPCVGTCQQTANYRLSEAYAPGQVGEGEFAAVDAKKPQPFPDGS
jgi:hypothetical protein